MIKQAIANFFYILGNKLDGDMSDFDRFYTYKDKIYYSWGLEKDNLRKVRNPDTGEWFDAVNYSEVRFFTMDGDDSGTRYYNTHGGDTYYREVEDFKKKFKKCKKSHLKDIKEIW